MTGFQINVVIGMLILSRLQNFLQQKKGVQGRVENMLAVVNFSAHYLMPGTIFHQYDSIAAGCQELIQPMTDTGHSLLAVYAECAVCF